jgi:hypothetical protein
MTQVKYDYQKADKTRESGKKIESIPMYLAVAANANQLTGSTAKASFTEKSTNQVSRLARLYLARIGHDLGGVYTFNDVDGMELCDRYDLAYLY